MFSCFQAMIPKRKLYSFGLFRMIEWHRMTFTLHYISFLLSFLLCLNRKTQSWFSNGVFCILHSSGERNAFQQGMSGLPNMFLTPLCCFLQLLLILFAVQRLNDATTAQVPTRGGCSWEHTSEEHDCVIVSLYNCLMCENNVMAFLSKWCYYYWSF